MLIVSQDEKCMTEDLNIYIKIYNPNFGEVIYAIENDEFVLGEYKTEERAKEVLKEIVMLFKDEKMLHIRKSTLNNLDELAEPKYILKPISRPKVYEMPKE